MKEMVTRFPENPILTSADVKPTRPDMVVECLLNPAAFRFDGKIGLLWRVAERPRQEEGWVSTEWHEVKAGLGGPALTPEPTPTRRSSRG